MNYILCIETAVEDSSVCLSSGKKIINFKQTTSSRDSAAWLHPAISDLLKESNILLKDVAAVAVSAGPGSYTGLRVGMATAKGLCYSLQVPLITISTLKMMAASTAADALASSSDISHLKNNLVCPMIDARRMEVFTAVYDMNMTELLQPQNLILENNSLKALLDKNFITFSGNGSIKFKQLVQHPNALFINNKFNAEHLVPFAIEAYERRYFTDLAYSEPFYGKEFYSPAPKQIL
ncbi:MAG: tRNA (adenosine(37)-N6)-threonylcarbamoyltransferase complex dimerization subunit type 1 TsaB [Bacteroidota bacterium]|nr:tRNA (adenosine(37)-N6)-threonylcarbamoyltransferase complex dimerization subunit type 1 TsaB [Bacteroidota bacterium]